MSYQTVARDGVVGDSLTAYLEEIGRQPLLTAEDEVELAQLIEAGREAAGRLTGNLDPAFGLLEKDS